MSVPRPEYPRPQFQRDRWMNLNGQWQFSFDEPVFDREITVPFAYQSKLSGIDLSERHDVVWYRRGFTLPEDWAGRTVMLHFGAVDYSCRVWVNDCLCGEHEGGHVGFELDVTRALRAGENQVTIQAVDVRSDMTMPRGKQYWKDQPESIFYTPTTGIWQTVWLEPVEEAHICRIDVTPDLDRRTVEFAYTLSREGLELEIEVEFQGTPIAKQRTEAYRAGGRVLVDLDKERLGGDNFISACAWSPEKPRLFDVVCRLYQAGELRDTVRSYFGLRKISVEDGVILLNNYPYCQKLLLDQGYWRDSLLTAPTDEDFISDIRYAKAMGFNGVRKHQKVEDPRFLYHADRLGFLVWEEMANAFEFSPDYVCRFTREWMEVLRRDYSHPCIVAWTPLNESWGVENICSDSRQAHHSRALVELTKSLDATRLVMSNDGWEQTIPDVLGVHDYAPEKDVLARRYSTLGSVLDHRPAGRALFAPGCSYAGQPVMVTECGGIFFNVEDTSGWGYTNAEREEDFYRIYHQVVSAMLGSPVLQGFCYTQLTDVQQEQNGLLTFDHRPKFDCEVIRAINEGRWREES